MDEISYNQPPDSQDINCDNPDCVDGMIPEYFYDDYDQPVKEMVTCKCQR